MTALDLMKKMAAQENARLRAVIESEMHQRRTPKHVEARRKQVKEMRLRGMHLKDIAAHFGVSRNAIDKDMIALRESGAWVDKGRLAA